MATTERRKSISQFFGFSKAEPKQESTPDYPKLRRKLQKVTKVDVDADDVPSGLVAVPASDGGVQTVKVPGDDSFLSTKYEACPRLSRAGSQVLPDSDEKTEDKRTRRSSRTRFFSRSSSTSRVPNSFRSASCTRAASTAAIRPESSRAESRPPVSYVPTRATPASPTTTAPTPTATTSLPADNDNNTQDKERAQEKAAQAAAHARALQMLHNHERVAAQEWAVKRKSSNASGFGSTETIRPKSATKSQQPASPSSPVQPLEGPSSRQYPQFHRPYTHSQHQTTPVPKEVDALQARLSMSRSPYMSRRSVPAPVTIPVSSTPVTVVPLSPVHSSFGSIESSTSRSSPTSATFSVSSGSLSFGSTSSINQSYSTLPRSSHSASSSCASSLDFARSSMFPQPLGYRGSTANKENKYEFESSTDGRVVPELSYLSRGGGHTPPTPDSPLSVSSTGSPSVKPKRKVKTPVYAIGQLENSSSGEDPTSKGVQQLSHTGHNIFNIQTPPQSPVFAMLASDNNEAELSLLQSKPSIECIAEEYRALLASRGSQSDAQSEVNVDVRQRLTPSGLRNRKSINNSDSKSTGPRRFMLASSNSDNAVPQSRNSNLDLPTKPGALPKEWSPHDFVPTPPASLPKAKMSPPPPLSPLQTRSSMLGARPPKATMTNHKTPPPQPDNLSLQICLDLLTRELSSAVTHRSSPSAAAAASQRAATRRQLQQRGVAGGIRDQQAFPSPISTASIPPPTESAGSAGSALQILVMIEAYERLRDQLVADARQRKRDNGVACAEIEAMFGLWLKSLYRIHDSLTNSSSSDDGSDGLSNTSESDYDSDDAAY